MTQSALAYHWSPSEFVVDAEAVGTVGTSVDVWDASEVRLVAEVLDQTVLQDLAPS